MFGIRGGVVIKLLDSYQSQGERERVTWNAVATAFAGP